MKIVRDEKKQQIRARRVLLSCKSNKPILIR